MRISDWSSDVCSSDLPVLLASRPMHLAQRRRGHRLGIDIDLTQAAATEAALEHRCDHVPGHGWRVVLQLRQHDHRFFGQKVLAIQRQHLAGFHRSEEHTSALQSLMRISYAVFCSKTQKTHTYCNHT